MKFTIKEVIKIRKPKLRYPVIRPIAERFSPRHFSSEKIPDKIINSIFEAVRLAPSAYNYQPWYFYWAENGSSSFNKIINCLSERNHWAKTAAVLVIGCCLPIIDGEEDRFAFYDLGASVMSLVFQAQTFGYYARQMGLFDKEKIKKALRIDKDKDPCIVVALGKIGNYKNAGEIYLQKDIQPHPKKTKISEKLSY